MWKFRAWNARNCLVFFQQCNNILQKHEKKNIKNDMSFFTTVYLSFILSEFLEFSVFLMTIFHEKKEKDFMHTIMSSSYTSYFFHRFIKKKSDL